MDCENMQPVDMDLTGDFSVSSSSIQQVRLFVAYHSAKSGIFEVDLIKHTSLI